ncbi:piggyBac transposable element-derived protein 4-like [Zootermopsis nevadensis]|uniref:piggyBac transposable element-derived protein 4-like n=1 Tax=Zootermopsis nevadensis TaxID=136037 RepID=UPI000B8E4D93|nr:piggyBac transposable element-derived protein 4-like [Zootermopsis nevadensis]
MPPPNSPPISYFLLFFTDFILSLMVTESNRYAQQFITSKGGNVSTHLKNWNRITTPEMKGFLACILNMGIVKKPTIASYWSILPSQATPWFGKMFSKHRFSQLLRFFHLVNNEGLAVPGETGYDPCAKYQPLVDHANRVFQHHYTPHQQLCVDESLMQYQPYKPHHPLGIKFWMICDSVSKYCLGFYTYGGARSQDDRDSIQKNGLGYTVVKKLLGIGGYLNKGYLVFVDKFFMSVPLVHHLYQLGTYVTGTIKRNRKFLPQQFKNKFSVGQKMYFRSGRILACAFREKKCQRHPAILLSSHATVQEQEVTLTGNGGNRKTTKPEIITTYNKFMGGIDTSDMVLYTYVDERRTIKYWKKVAFNIIARMVLNSYILYKENYRGPDKVRSRRSYTVAIIETLGEDWMTLKGGTVDDPRGPPGIRKLPEKKEYRCVVCSTKEMRRRSRTVCKRCNRGLHGECFPKHRC